MAEMGGGEGLPGASESYQELAKIWGEEGLPGARASCQEMAGIEGQKGRSRELALAAGNWQKWGWRGAALSWR